MQIVYPLYPWSSDFIHDLNAAIGILDSTFTADIKVRLQIGYGVDARTGDPLTDQNTSYAAPSQLYPLSYSDLSNNLKAAIPGFFNDNNLPEGSASIQFRISTSLQPRRARLGSYQLTRAIVISMVMSV